MPNKRVDAKQCDDTTTPDEASRIPKKKSKHPVHHGYIFHCSHRRAKLYIYMKVNFSNKKDERESAFQVNHIFFVCTMKKKQNNIYFFRAIISKGKWVYE